MTKNCDNCKTLCKNIEKATCEFNTLTDEYNKLAEIHNLLVDKCNIQNSCSDECSSDSSENISDNESENISYNESELELSDKESVIKQESSETKEDGKTIPKKLKLEFWISL